MAASRADTGCRLFLVRHGRPRIERDQMASEWVLEPAGFPAIDRLRSLGRLPPDAAWFSSPEPKALATASRLTDGVVTVVKDLREQERRSVEWRGDFCDVVRRAFDRPAHPALVGWEPLAATQVRVLAAVRRIRVVHPLGDLVLVGHGTAWTVLKAALTGRAPDLERWAQMQMPDVDVVDGR